MRDLTQELEALPRDGVYLSRPAEIMDYRREYPFGYAVPIRTLTTSDLNTGSLFVKTGGEDPDYLFANHIDLVRDARAVALAAGARRVYDLREREWINTTALRG